jgi:2-polyprenyl-3-methyl-5-hydroxy-6-metoxy-1,4-benzoquinol methylase
MVVDLDSQLTSTFTRRMIDLLNSAAQVLFISLGYKTGLFTTLARLPPSSSAQIAVAAGLNERYVREWLGAVVVSGLVDYDPEKRTYALPPATAAVLVGSATPSLAGHCQAAPVLMSQEPALLDCFKAGGGLPYSAFAAFKASVRVGDPNSDALLLEQILPVAPGLVERLQTGAEVGEIACGLGHRLMVMARAFPLSRFTGFDYAERAIATASGEARRQGLTNVSFELQDVAELDLDEAFDVVIGFDAIHDLAKPRAVLEAVHTALRPGGAFFMADVRASSYLEQNVSHPLGPWFYAWSLTHCMPKSLAENGEGLGSLWGQERALEYLGEAGFNDVQVQTKDADLIDIYYICRKDRTANRN